MCMEDSPGICRKCDGATEGVKPLWTATSTSLHTAQTSTDTVLTLPALSNPCSGGEHFMCGLAAFPGQAFCAPPGHWSTLEDWKFKLLFRQTVTPGTSWVRTAQEWRAGVEVNAEQWIWDGTKHVRADIPLYSVLHTLGDEHRDTDGKFLFVLVWPGFQAQVWKQSSNPMTEPECTVTGYEPLSTPYTEKEWGGLESCSEYSLLDGSSLRPDGLRPNRAQRVGRTAWYAVGATGLTPGGVVLSDQASIKGPGVDVQQVELYVLDLNAVQPVVPTPHSTHI